MTAIPKTYDRQSVEEKWRKYWERKKIFKFTFQPDKPLFIVDTPPPYVSAEHLHAGHIMSYSQAEFVVRFKRMQGFNVFYPMGFDDNGLPTERFVEKKYNIDKSKITKSQFIKLCLQETELGSLTYRQLWHKLGISVDWSKTYSTINPLAQKVSQWSIIDLYRQGALYRSERPILWCPYCQTALAQGDLEDLEEESLMNFINFKTAGGKKLTIATTRPELLPACVALYFNPQDKRFTKLTDKKAQVPLFHYEVPIKTSPQVDPGLGTGLMMVCTWGDQEDLEKWHDDHLITRAIVTEQGILNELAAPYQGLSLTQARQQITADLKKTGQLIKQEPVTHTKNVHERCTTPTEFILSKQWFIKITDLKQDWLRRGQEINWYPANKKQIYDNWIKSLKWDWCVSRQRYYGVPIPVWYCENCEEPIFAEIKDLPVNPLEAPPPLSRCLKCHHKKFIPEKDVLDTWATSSCTPFLLRELVSETLLKKKMFPVTLRPNAFEIIRTWDFYSIVKSHYHFNDIPFKNLMISGHGLDEQGRKIAKRLKNYIPADELLEKYGADPIRYWATGASLGENLRFSLPEIEKGKKTTTKLWNVGRFVKMNSEQLNLASTLTTPPLQPEEIFKKQTALALEEADLWIINLLNSTIKQTTQAFEQYTYAKARNVIDELFWSKLADYYVEFIKYRLSNNYQFKSSKIAAWLTLTIVFKNILKLYAPILPFVTEEIYHLLFLKRGEKSIHLTVWPQPVPVASQLNISDFPQAIAAIDEIRKYKSEAGLSLGKEVEEYTLKTKVDLEKYGNFIKQAIRVKKLKTS